ncbi:hypothetical protein F5884DRAFT_819694 [Xylogone sp. PMI_703]|nr:hypothetical protein F5884DRAFT_819694 [Xylogone sp. PMI_703]
MVFTPETYQEGCAPVIRETTGEGWTPLYWHECSFPPKVFSQVMLNQIRNPNINSSHLFRADILFNSPYTENFQPSGDILPRIVHFRGFDLKDVIHGICSIHFSYFDTIPREPKLDKIALNLLSTLHKHGEGTVGGYVKRVHHDVILPQATVQNIYAQLKIKYAKALIDSWVEVTDPTKHVFEDLGIAAFLIALWAEMYRETEFPGFVDIGCGNGLLVHILIEEGYNGYGFDARKRKSWEELYNTRTQEHLKELVLIPSILTDAEDSILSMECEDSKPGIHNGVFPKGTFIISNHADELTPWTPLLGNISESPFMMIPCCSHALSGARFRAPPSKETGASNSAYASLVHWVSDLARQCGWEVEKEMLRIPSTRNTALIGRRRSKPFEEVDVREILGNNGGATGWEANSMKLVKGEIRGH